MIKTKTVLLAIISVLIAGCQPSATSATGSDIQFLHMPGTEGIGLPFSSAVRVDNTIYLSGVIGLEPGTQRPAEGGIQGRGQGCDGDDPGDPGNVWFIHGSSGQVHRISCRRK